MRPHKCVVVAQAALLLGCVLFLDHVAGPEAAGLAAIEDKKDKDGDKKNKGGKKDKDHDKKDKDKDSDKKGKDSKKDHGPLKHLEIRVGGHEREALVAYPKTGKEKKKPAPVIFAFHGHGNTMKGAAEAFEFHEHWDDAICVYVQGVKTPSLHDPQGKEAGWEVVGERDYLVFDAFLGELKRKHAVDESRIFATGFSNGAHFTYGLWARRGKVLRAVAPCAGYYDLTPALPPKPCLIVAGAKDPAFDKQKHTAELARKVNGCEGNGIDWPKHKSKLDGTLYPSTKGAPTVTLLHGRGHMVPNAAGALIVEFFKDVSKR